MSDLAPITSGQTLSHFKVGGKIGEGAMGVVYRAMDITLRRPVALKVLRPETFRIEGSRQRFLHEARSAARLTHPNVVSVYEFGEEGGVTYLAMEFVDGQTANELLRRNGPLPPRDCITLAIQAVSGLAHAHAAGMIHRDIKPANLMLDRDGRLRVLDFGLARAVDSPNLTEQGIVLGTPDYMSPEQAQAEAQDLRSDIFSLGVVLFQLATNQLPYQGRSTLEVLRQRVEVEAPSPAKLAPELPASLVKVIRRCLARDPAARYPSYDALGADLVEGLADLPQESQLPGAAQLTNSQVMTLAHFDAAATETGVTRSSPRVEGPEPFPQGEGVRVHQAGTFLVSPRRAMEGIAGNPAPDPLEVVRDLGELMLVSWGLGLILGGHFWLAIGIFQWVTVAVVYAACLLVVNQVRRGRLGPGQASRIGVWCTAPFLLAGAHPWVARLASILYLGIAARLVLTSAGPGFGAPPAKLVRGSRGEADAGPPTRVVRP